MNSKQVTGTSPVIRVGGKLADGHRYFAVRVHHPQNLLKAHERVVILIEDVKFLPIQRLYNVDICLEKIKVAKVRRTCGMMVTNDRSQTLLLAWWLFLVWWISIELHARLMYVRPDE